MKKIFILAISSFIGFNSFAQQNVESIPNLPKLSIIPEPVSLYQSAGFFELPKEITIQSNQNEDFKQSLLFLKQKLSTATGYPVKVLSEANALAAIKLVLHAKTDSLIGKEGYQLSVNPKEIVIKANTNKGLFYGMQTLLQLLPKEIESKELVKNISWKVPSVEITDYPRVGWRGLMFDVSRHFFTKNDVKQYIDAMVRYKYNVLHLHLTDDEGWRLEIKGLPKLTEVGAWSVKKTGTFGFFTPPTETEPRTYGGFYTHEDITELVNYAKERFVDILPEIDVPGHSLAAIAAYPELSCTKGAEKYKVRSGEQIMDWSRGAPPIAFYDNNLCPANEKVYAFLDTVFTQVAQLFPFEYIHVGGDEAALNFWEKNPAIAEMMKREKMKNIHGVQGYFERRVEKIINSKGKKFMGWDEILEGGVEPTASVMSWRDQKYGIEASNKKHEVVMSPTAFAYLDYMQADAITEPKVYATLRLNKTYEFDPIPAGANPEYIKGGQANLWTEQVYNIRQAEYMTWPRGFAIAESVWSPKEKKNWKGFVEKVENHFDRLKLAETKYAPSMYDPIFTPRRLADKQLLIELTTEIDGLDMYYT
ncbi:MAG: beta-N-acetylhexosaminidase, partial [Sphingobacteriaceae bacterium]|nr:beta-N-acetylhexosaminidase [Sphingobacteriaceae bacterium]